MEQAARAGSEFPIAIVGAGFAGIGTAIRLKKAGIHSFTIFERAGDVGGTWRDNRYPGAACDVPSHVYSLSFESNPAWSHKYCGSEEIWRYLRGLVDKWQLGPHLRLNTAVTSARFDESRGAWTLTTDRDEAITARVVVSCVGGLVDPRLPDIKGLHAFEGEIFHTARWRSDVELAGRRVAVIGTGASAVQVVPGVAHEVERLHVFQRTPGWVVPRLDRAYSEREKRWFTRHPSLLWLSRMWKYWSSELRGPMIFLDSPRLSRLGERLSLAHLEAQVHDPELRRKLTPTFQFGCKRILVSDDYWSTFERPNVELVTDPIEEITRVGVRTSDGRERELDVIVLATGFDVGLSAAPFPIVGRGGRLLGDAWRSGAAAYKGMAVSGFPNWFILMGPNTGPGHTSVLVYTEAQIQHVLGAIRAIRSEGLRFVDVRQVVQNRYNRGLQRRMPHMVWGTGCHSWYLSEDGANHSLYPGPAFEYALRAARFRASDYEFAR